MKKNITYDERIVNETNAIKSKAFTYCFLGLIVSLFYRTFFLNQTLQDCWDIYAIIVLISLYVSVKYAKSGLFSTGSKKDHYKKKKKILFISIIATAVYTSVMFIIGAFEKSNGLQTAGAILIFFVSWNMVQQLILKWSERRANRDLE